MRLYTKYSDAKENRPIRTQPDGVCACVLCGQAMFPIFFFFMLGVVFSHLLRILAEHKMELGREKIEYVWNGHTLASAEHKNERGVAMLPIRICMYQFESGDGELHIYECDA